MKFNPHYGYFYKDPEDLIKAGEGSRGGKVIGHTRSGKPVYEDHTHPSHSEFNYKEHSDAAGLHDKAYEEAQTAHKEEDRKYTRAGKVAREKMSLTPKEARQKHQIDRQVSSNWHEEQAANQSKSGLQKAFSAVLDLFKGGPGSGQQGHTTEHLPMPGEEAHKLPPTQAAVKTYMPPGGVMPHYTDQDNPELSAYKNLLRLHTKHGMDYHGHVTFDPETKRMHVLTSKGQENVKALQQHYGVKPKDSKE